MGFFLSVASEEFWIGCHRVHGRFRHRRALFKLRAPVRQSFLGKRLIAAEVRLMTGAFKYQIQATLKQDSFGCAESHEAEMLIQFFTNETDDFSHGESCQYRSDTKSFDVSETNAGDQCCGYKTDNIEGYFYF